MSLFLRHVPKPVIRCEKCRHQGSFESFLREKNLSAPYESVIQADLVCPRCGFVRHCYYLSQETRLRRSEIQREIRQLSNHLDQKNYDRIVTLREEYGSIFDEDQVKYKEALEKAVQDESGT